MDMGKIDWFSHARFGMFIHWGIYAIPARGEWVKSVECLGDEVYDQYFREFNPVRYNPREWVRVAKEAGQKYIVITTKHHDGFCLFDSALTTYTALHTPVRKDLIREFVEACREEGLRIGFYYSLLDWHHPHYPVDEFHPQRNKETQHTESRDFSQYLTYLHGQVQELLTNYGKIDILWLDFSYGALSGEAWRATELVRMIRKLQPDILLNNRLGGDLRDENPPEYAGDFLTPEQIIPPEAVTNAKGQPIPWEACITLNNHWGYCASDKAYKSPKQIIRALVECVSKNGNLLVNVGPNAWGEFPEEAVNILKEVGRWMQKNGESIYGCGAANLPKPEWGRYTQKGNKLYAHIFEKPIGYVPLRDLAGKVRKARLLADGSEIRLLQKPWNAREYEHYLFLEIPENLWDENDTVVELELEEPLS
uniref:alpha-L-fucosidase n=1 Tax=Candidatus Caldatribacterium saccharofermentans TaxID=1454753 RepID=A0A7V4TXN7_9BACT